MNSPTPRKVPIKPVILTCMLLLVGGQLSGFKLPGTVVPEKIHSFPSNTSLEGPAWSVQEQALYFSVQAGAFGTYRWTEARGLERARDSSGKVNGNAIDAAGRLVICDSVNRRILRVEEDFAETVLASEFEGRALNQPNDLIIRSDGTIWFTTPTWSAGETPYQYVLKVDPLTGEVTKMVSGIDKPNGLGFSPDESILYLNDNGANRVLAYSIHPDGTVAAAPTVLLDNIDKWPDGMCVDAEGNLFVAVYSGSMAGIRILSKDGEFLGRISFPGITDGITNCTFGNPSEHILWVTAKNELYRVDLSAGYPPPPPAVEAEWTGGELMLRWEPAPAVVYHLAGSSDLQNWQSSPVQPVEEAGLLKAVVDSWASLPYWRVEASRE
ncbi:MAG: SMP-30/gluconolactonase/LRE family protein [Oceanipulchritudo sp.]